VHRAILKRADMTMSDGVRVTTILRTLHDLANDAEFPPDQFRSAIADATMRGMVNAKILRKQINALDIPATRKHALLQ